MITDLIIDLTKIIAHACYEGFDEFVYETRNFSAGKNADGTFPMIQRTRKHRPSDVQVVACFPQTWGSTALGFGGLGGQAITGAYTTIVSSTLHGTYLVYFGGRFAYRIDQPSEQFWIDVHARKMREVAARGCYVRRKTD